MFTLWNTFHLTSLPNFHQEKSRLAESKSTKSSVKPPWSPCISYWICIPTHSPLFSPTGKGGIYFPSNFYCRVRDEDHSVRVVATPDRVPPECLEPLRFYNCHDRVSEWRCCLFVREREQASKQSFKVLHYWRENSTWTAMIVSRAGVSDLGSCFVAPELVA